MGKEVLGRNKSKEEKRKIKMGKAKKGILLGERSFGGVGKKRKRGGKRMEEENLGKGRCGNTAAGRI